MTAIEAFAINADGTAGRITLDRGDKSSYLEPLTKAVDCTNVEPVGIELDDGTVVTFWFDEEGFMKPNPKLNMGVPHYMRALKPLGMLQPFVGNCVVTCSDLVSGDEVSLPAEVMKKFEEMAATV